MSPPRVIPLDKVTTELSPEFPAAHSVRFDERLCVRVQAACGGILDADGLSADEEGNPMPKSNRPNPMTGPIAVDGLKAGETFALQIHEMRPLGFGRSGRTVYTPDGTDLCFLDGLRIPQNPSIGCVGLAPATLQLATDNMKAASHGGNWDCLEIGPGCTLFQVARIDGGNWGMGDVHMAMGDGEITGSGVESACEIVCTPRRARSLRVADAIQISKPGAAGADNEWPWFVKNGEIQALGAHTEFRLAFHIAFENLIAVCTQAFGCSREAVTDRLGGAGVLRVCQGVCEVITLRCCVPLRLFGTTEDRFLCDWLLPEQTHSGIRGEHE